MDLIIRNAAVQGHAASGTVDIGIEGGRIVAVEKALSADAEVLDVGGRLVSPGFIETHIHLDKSCLLGRCASKRGDLEEAIAEVSRAKRDFTAEDVYERGSRTLRKAISQGTTHMRTHLEVDPIVGLRSLDGVEQLAEDYRWAIDLDICVFPQEGLLNNPGTDELMVEALRRGCRVVGAAPYTDSDPHGQMDRIFEMAREFDVDIDMHLDLSLDPTSLALDYVCELTERFKYGGRVTIGHVTKLSAVSPQRFAEAARRMADTGVALTVLPSTDLFLMGRDADRNVPRGVTPCHHLLDYGVNCSLSTNNVLNPFTPFGDCSLVRMANLYANVAHVGSAEHMQDCFDMVSERSARMLRLDDYGVAPGCAADLVVLDCVDKAQAISENAPVLFGFKRGRRSFTRLPVELHAPA
ncbi:cytosine deaminase [Natronocella acetinitrilica]|uniref:Cytosine deaminase n=1 Tax=Natronocella acetinitrilica TaxID=414046 RepID=A0AAE3G816_9GAMM|nr:amidohydrolase family protein [Natronocella acetinitrilica]MCP1676748.1 cytosine deaminase [Natronocella acetinitrilica]